MNSSYPSNPQPKNPYYQISFLTQISLKRSTDEVLKELQTSQARRQGFKAKNALFVKKDVSSKSGFLDLSPESSIIENLLLLILDEKGRRRLMLRSKSNEELFSLYKAELALRIRNQDNLERYCQVLDQFQEFLADNPPSSLLAKSFLGKWSKQKPATLYKYLSIIKGFLNWYGEDIDLKVRLPRQLPEYIEDENIQKLIEAIKKKQTHKNAIDRDILLIELAYNSGLRREELANLRVSDILLNENALIVRKGKGMKDRSVPLPSRVIKLLIKHIDGMNSDDKVFNVKPTAISDKIRRIANSAGVKIHAHSLRHGYATRLLEKGANIKAVQELLGHSRIGTTEAYLSLLPKHLRETVDLLETSNISTEEKPTVHEQLRMQAIVALKAVCKPSWGYPPEIMISEYHSHFIASNEGNSPAVEIEMALINSNHKLLEGMRETFLGVGEKIEFKPLLCQSAGRYYILCQYRQVSLQNGDELWNQTWLPFDLSTTNKEGEVYVAPGELEFKFVIGKKNKIRVFSENIKRG